MKRFWALIVFISLGFGQNVFSVRDTIRIGIPIIPASVVIVCGNDTIPRDSVIIKADGTIIFSSKPHCDSVKINYFPANALFMPTKSNLLLWGTEKENIKAPTNTPQQQATSINTNGYITQGIRVDQGSNLSSTGSLRLEAYGELPMNFSFHALLSDQNVPFQPEGTTLELNEFDKILIELSSPHLCASIGDIDANIKAGEFLNFTRRVQGALLATKFEHMNASGFGSINRGKFASQRIYPQEGNQGPYQLYGASGESDITILAGTERVWLNGKLLVRGLDNDYTIDYNLAQIMFTPKRPINSSDIIFVEFQYITGVFRQQFFGGQIALTPSKSMSLGIGFASQLDDRKHPLSAIDSSVMATLTSSGDSVPDSIVSPQKLWLFTSKVGLNLNLASISIEQAISSFDRNTFSTRDDEDNISNAIAVQSKLKISDALSFEGRVRYLRKNFSTFGVLEKPESQRQWGIAKYAGTDELTTELGANAKIGTVNLSTMAGRRKVGDKISQRASAVMSYGSEPISTNAKFNIVKFSGTRRITATLDGKTKIFKKNSASLIWNWENFNGAADTNRMNLDPSINLSTGSLKLVFGVGVRTQDIRRENRYNPFYRVFSPKISAHLPGVNILFSRRYYNSFDSAAGNDFVDNLVKLSGRRGFKWINIGFDYSVSGSQTEVLKKVYEEVEPGRGSYRFDEQLGEYIPDPNGDYILRYEHTGEFSRSIRSNGNITFSANANRYLGGSRLSSYLSFNLANKKTDLLSSLPFPATLSSDSLCFANMSAELSLSALQSKSVKLEFVARNYTNIRRDLASGEETNRESQFWQAMSGRIAGFFVKGKLIYTKKRAKRPALRGELSEAEKSIDLSASKTFLRKLHTNHSIKLSLVSGYTTNAPFDANIIKYTAEVSVSVFRFTARTHAELINIGSSMEVLPYEVAGGFTRGLNYNLTIAGTYRAGSMTDLILNLRAMKKSIAKADYDVELRIRLRF